MRIMVLGMQSSGASLFTFFLAQKQGSLAVIDLDCETLAPEFKEVKVEDIILKSTITKKIAIETQIKRFKPDKTVFFLRNPFDTYASLETKWYRDRGGPIDEKFRVLEKIFKKRNQFDAFLTYEDFLSNPAKCVKELQETGFDVKQSFLEFKRAKEEILEFNIKHSAWCKKFFKKKWGFGNIHFTGFFKKRPKLSGFKNKKNIADWKKEKILKICPRVCSYYKKRGQLES